MPTLQSRLLLPLVSLALLAGCNEGKAPTGSSDMGGLSTLSTDCTDPTGPGTEHSGILTSDETWTVANSPHIITSDTRVRGGATLTIEPCTLVKVRGTASLTIGGHNVADGTGTLLAKGTYDQATDRASPVVFAPEQETGYWGSLQVFATGRATLNATGLLRGGNNDDGALLVWGDDNRKVVQPLVDATLLIIQDAAGLGIHLRSSGGFSMTSAGVVVIGSGKMGHVVGDLDTRYAVYAEAPAIHTIPQGQYTGNAVDGILAKAPFTIEVDETFANRGVPYQIVNSFAMVPPAIGTTTTLHIDAGVTIKLGGPQYTTPALDLGSGNGGSGISAVRLDAAGTAAAPIKITSGAPSPVAGDWVGIRWQGGPTSGNVMSNVTVEYGGAASGTNSFGCGPKANDALLLINYWRPDDVFIKSSTFAHSKAGGIVSGWDSASAGPNLRGDNTFVDIADACQVSQPANASHVCPGNDATPDCY